MEISIFRSRMTEVVVLRLTYFRGRYGLLKRGRVESAI